MKRPRKSYSAEEFALEMGRNTYLYRAPKGDFFVVHQTRRQGEQERIGPLPLDEAVALFKNLNEQRMSFENAFPGVEIS